MGEAAGDSGVSIEVVDGSRFNDVLSAMQAQTPSGATPARCPGTAELVPTSLGRSRIWISIFDTAFGSSNVDTINDFSVANGDFIQLSTSVFSIDMFDVTLASHQFNKGTAATSSTPDHL